jgi:hypothetical protein
MNVARLVNCYLLSAIRSTPCHAYTVDVVYVKNTILERGSRLQSIARAKRSCWGCSFQRRQLLVWRRRSSKGKPKNDLSQIVLTGPTEALCR